jgi:hypothetical protein
MATRKPQKRKQPAPVEPAIETTPAAPRKPGRCVVCGEEVAPFSTEELCWVCRRLKISAWRETDSQAAAQE